MKLERPDKIAICFVDGDKTRTEEQINQLSGVENIFNVEWIKRYEIFSGPYISFSQIINECVVNSESEFMIFINPKTIVSAEDISTIINDLCNGFAFSSICSFGFWGATKELFRQIGMMDERFIGGEYEDNDFSLRIKQLDAAVNWRFIVSKYPWSPFTKKPAIRHITNTLFRMKWHIFNDLHYRTDQFPEEKLLPLKIRNNYREDIRKSWKTWDKSLGDNVSHVSRQANAAIFSDKIAKSNLVKGSGKLFFKHHESGQMEITFKCNIPTELHIVIVNANPIGEEGTLYFRETELSTNTWYRFPISSGIYDIRVFHQGKMVLNNMQYHFPKNIEYDLGLNICQFQV